MTMMDNIIFCNMPIQTLALHRDAVRKPFQGDVYKQENATWSFQGNRFYSVGSTSYSKTPHVMYIYIYIDPYNCEVWISFFLGVLHY